GIMSSVASDAGYVVLPPLGALLYLALGRHPLAGLAAAFAGVSAGFSANLLLSGTDVMLAELTAAAAAVIDPAYADSINVAMNWYLDRKSTRLNYTTLFRSVRCITAAWCLIILSTWQTPACGSGCSLCRCIGRVLSELAVKRYRRYACRINSCSSCSD